MTILRLWRGWTTPENADAYQRVVLEHVIPAIEARRIPGFLQIDVLRVPSDPSPDRGEVEFATIMTFETADCINAFVGADSTLSHVPEEARAILLRFDERATHFDVIDRRPQPPLKQSAAPRWAAPTSLQLGPVGLEPLSPAHVPALREAALDGKLWDLWYTAVPRPEEMEAAVQKRLILQAEGHWLPFAVIDRTTGQAVGMTSYLHIERDVRRLEIGGTWYRRSAQGGIVNPACKMLLLHHAFEHLGCIAVELRTHVLNAQSRRAIEAIGGKLDGVLRNHFDAFGQPRDTCVYSIIAPEWPTVQRHLAWRLSRFGVPSSAEAIVPPGMAT